MCVCVVFFFYQAPIFLVKILLKVMERKKKGNECKGTHFQTWNKNKTTNFNTQKEKKKRKEKVLGNIQAKVWRMDIPLS